MKDSLIFGFVVSAPILTAIFILLHMIDKGEPHFFRAVVMGVVISLANIAVIGWMKKNNSNTDNNEQT